MRPGWAPDSPGQGVSPEPSSSALAHTASSWGGGRAVELQGVESVQGGTKFSFKTRAAKTHMPSTGAGCVSSQEQTSSPEQSLPPGDTRQEGAVPTLSRGRAPWVSVAVPRVLSQLCRAKNKGTKRPRMGRSAQPACEGHGAPPHPLTRWEACQGPPPQPAAPRGQPLRFHPFTTQTDLLGCLTLHRALSQTPPGPFQPPT